MKNVQSKQLKIAKRYASALVAFDNNAEILQELYSVCDVLQKSPDLKEFLENPIIKKNDKKSVLDEIFVKAFSPNVLNFMKLLVDKGRFSYFDAILSVLQSELDEKNNVARVLIISAVDLTEDEKKKVGKKLEEKLKKTVKPAYETDESIIAGLVVKIGDKVVDNSLRAKLDTMKRQLI